MDATNLRMLIELATTARDAAGARRAQAAAAVDAARQQLATLQGYAADYALRAQTALAQGGDIAAQNNLRAFSAKLGKAMEQQRNEVARREQVLAAAEHEFNDAQRKVKSLQALQARGAEQARVVAQRREQKLVDELAQTMLSSQERPLAAGGW
jgi:flagellar FliJ protein